MKTQAHVFVDATPEAIFEVLVQDRTDFSKNDEVRITESIGSLPIGVGYRLKSTFIHKRRRCEMFTTVTRFEPGRLIEEDYFHHCRVTDRSVRGTLRFEVLAGPAGSTVLATRRQSASGLFGWLATPFGRSRDLCRTLAWLGARAEARSPSVANVS